MSRSLKPLEKMAKPGGSTPIAKIFLPQAASALPIRINGGSALRQIAESTRRRGRPA